MYNIKEDFYNYQQYKNYNNIEQSFVHNQFIFYNKIFCLLNNENSLNISKAKINETNNRLIVLFENSTTGKKILNLYEINLNSIKNIHGLKINLM
jgi:hypothetical protein